MATEREKVEETTVEGAYIDGDGIETLVYPGEPARIVKKLWRLAHITDADRAMVRAKLFAELAAVIQPGFTYTVNVFEIDGRAVAGQGYELVTSASFIRAIDLPIASTPE